MFIRMLQFLAQAIPFILLCLAARKANLNKIDRGRQVLMPFIALLYCTIVASDLNAVPFPADRNYGVDIRIPSIFIKCRDKSLYESVQSIDCSYISCAERDFPSYFEQDMEV